MVIATISLLFAKTDTRNGLMNYFDAMLFDEEILIPIILWIAYIIILLIYLILILKNISSKFLITFGVFGILMAGTALGISLYNSLMYDEWSIIFLLTISGSGGFLVFNVVTEIIYSFLKKIELLD